MLAWLVPPLAVFRRAGAFGTAFWLATALTVLGYVPGVLFARWYTRRPRRGPARPAPTA